MSQSANGESSKAVTVIVPVYRNLAVTKNCLGTLLDSDLPSWASVVVIDDHSPEPQLSQYCAELAEKNGFRLISNRENLGFVKSANHGFSLDPAADVILLNSDTRVSRNWVQRLHNAAYCKQDIGTVTPFSNNGTICSYPVFPMSNTLPAGWTQDDMDDLFSRANEGLTCEIPTAVGFCMYIKRECLDQTGHFDEENFGHGYGEETDFCLRASAKGWKHLIAADTFVFHEGAASFAEESSNRKESAEQVMLELHPQYHALITDFLQQDPLYPLRQNVDLRRLAVKPEDRHAVLEEHKQYEQGLRDTITTLEAERRSLEQLLAQCRSEFAATDKALEQADKVVSDQQEDIHNLQTYAKSLEAHIEKMEQSRSWRYTRWLRRED